MKEKNVFYVVFFTLTVLFSGTTSQHQPSVIIIGAGVAGITAASKLLGNNITDILVLEAEDRIGGRINSMQFGDGTVDLGAQACVGGKNALVYNMVKDYDLLEPISGLKSIYQLPAGGQIDQNFTKELEKVMYSITLQEVPDNISLGEFVTVEYKKRILKRYKSDPQKTKLALKFLSTLEKRNLLYGGGFTWFDKSAKASFQKSRTRTSFDWKGQGYKAFLNFLLKRQPDIEHKIMLNKRVDKIYWKDDVSVRCSDGSVYTANHIIVTVSLGVLKDNINNMFEPELPAEKMDAIKTIGMSAKAVTFLNFPVRWWPTDIYSVGFVWSNKEFENTSTSNVYQPWMLSFYGIYTVTQNPHVLEAWFSGTYVPYIELLSDEDLLKGIMLTLNTFFNQNIAMPKAMLRTRWHSNHNFLGTVSYDTVESYKLSYREILLQPLSRADGKLSLLFAGEATSVTRYAMVDGAVESGFREADRIISLYK